MILLVSTKTCCAAAGFASRRSPVVDVAQHSVAQARDERKAGVRRALPYQQQPKAALLAATTKTCRVHRPVVRLPTARRSWQLLKERDKIVANQLGVRPSSQNAGTAGCETGRISARGQKRVLRQRLLVQLTRKQRKMCRCRTAEPPRDGLGASEALSTQDLTRSHIRALLEAGAAC